jgi:PAS domain S-box-containing protein
MWEKIVLNLMSNALKFTFDGQITISLQHSETGVVFRVSDSGVGVSEHELPRLFERFHRVEGTRSRTHEGSGIGLALVQELVKLHGGSIRVDSQVGVGTTFAIEIPRGSAHLPAERIGAARVVATSSTAHAFVDEASRWSLDVVSAAPVEKSGATVLIADDNADMREYLRRTLVTRWVVLEARDGVEALAIARTQQPDLILTDVMMPGLDGFALLRELRADQRTRLAPIVMLSARAGEEARVEGLEAGADDYLVKPFSARELVARVTTHLELARLLRSIDEERRKLYAAFMEAPVAVAVMSGPDFVYELANPLYEEMFGRGVAGKSVREAFPEIPPEGSAYQLLERVYRTGEAITENEYPMTLERRPGVREERFYQFTIQPIREAGDVARLITVGIDVTAQVVARRAVEASEARFRNLVDQVRAGIAQIGFDGRYLYTNERFREIVGRSEAELLQLRMQQITHPDDLAQNLELFQRAVEHGTPFMFEKRLVRPDGSIVWVQNSVSRMEDADGRPICIASIAIDVTQKRYAEQALRESEDRYRTLAGELHLVVEREQSARQDAERAARFSEMFIGILGHDLRNPLSAITTAASLLEARADSERIAKPVTRIAASADRMARMIEQLLDLTHIRLGRGLPLKFTRADLAEIVRAAIDEIETASKCDIKLHVTGDPSGTWDRDRLSQLVSNLVANACTHGVRDAPVIIKIDGTHDHVELEVHNAGSIPRDVLPDVFEPMRNVYRERRKGSSGLGLGLYITQQIVLAHQGNIRVASDDLDGTRFVVELPRTASASEHVFGTADDSSSA